MTTSLDTAVEVVPGALYECGGMIPLDGRVSWMSREARGYQPVSGYVLTTETGALLVDTGVALHQQDVFAQISSALGERTEVDLFFTRAELDCVGNLGAVANAFSIRGPLDTLPASGLT